MVAILEPPVTRNHNPARADFLIHRSDEPSSTGKYYDLSIKQIQSTDTQYLSQHEEDHPPGDEQRRACYLRIEAALEKCIEDKNHHYANIQSIVPVCPIVMSSGGTLHKNFHLLLKDLQHDGLLRRSIMIDMSLTLVRARASTFILA